MTRIFTALQNTTGSPGMFYGFAEGFMAMEKLHLAKASQAQKDLLNDVISGGSGDEYLPDDFGAVTDPDADPTPAVTDPDDSALPDPADIPPGTQFQINRNAPPVGPTGPGPSVPGTTMATGPSPDDTASVDPSGLSPDPGLLEAINLAGSGLAIIVPPLGWVGRAANRLLGRTIGGNMDVPPKPEAPAEEPKSWSTKVPDSAADPKPNMTGSKKAAKPNTVAQEEFDTGEAARQEEERKRVEAEAKKAVGNYGGID